MITDPAHPVVDPGVGRNKAIGSVLIVQAESIEKARKIIEEDAYAQTGVVSGGHAGLLCCSTGAVGQGKARHRAFYCGDAVSRMRLGWAGLSSSAGIIRMRTGIYSLLPA